MSDFMEMPIGDMCINKEGAMRDAQQIIRELGAIVVFKPFIESRVERDRLGSVKKRGLGSVDPVNFYAFPIIFNPSTKILNQTGMKEGIQCLIKTSMLDWKEKGFSMERIQGLDAIRARIEINGADYEIRDKQLDSQYQDEFLYLHIGLNKV